MGYECVSGPCEDFRFGVAESITLGMMRDCDEGPNVERTWWCDLCDLDRDGDVDQTDFGLFQAKEK